MARSSPLKPLTEEAMTRLERQFITEQDRRATRPDELARMPGDSDAMHSARVASLEMRLNRLAATAAWSHKNEGTPETHAHASRTRQGALARLHLSGSISADQLAWAVEIATVAEMIERDVAVRTASLETRVDCSSSAKNALVGGIMRVRREVAYGYWREWIPQPKRAVLDMLVGEPLSYVETAKAYRMHNRRTKRLLIQAIDLWPDAMEEAENEVDEATIAAYRAGLI